MSNYGFIDDETIVNKLKKSVIVLDMVCMEQLCI